MDIVPLLPWIYAILLTIVHFTGERIAQHRHRDALTSFAAGVTVTYIFLQLLPEHYNGIQQLGDFGWLPALSGFAVLHATEKYIYQHEKTVDEVRHDFKELHSLFLFLYYAIIGVILTYLLQRSVVDGTLFFIPVLLHTAISSLSLSELHDDILENPLVHGSIFSATLIGAGLAAALPLTPVTFHLLLGVLTGMFLYVIIHDSLAQKEDGYAFTFILGTVLYSALIIALWTIG